MYDPADASQLQCLAPGSLTTYKCLAYYARNASGFFDVKKIPPSPRIIRFGPARVIN